MWFESTIRNQLRQILANQKTIILENKIPPLDDRIEDIEELGLYIHIPFCRQICPYCPYNKEIFQSEVADRYSKAVIEEIDIYSEMIGRKPITSLYVGGGTPTTMLYCGLEEIFTHIFDMFNVQCDIHMESHPNDLSMENLDTILSMGVRHLSIGVEALQDRHLRTLNRPYSVGEVKAAVERAVSKGFKCVNVDIIFALPGQFCSEIEQAMHDLVEMGVDQIATYPLFIFPYTKMGRAASNKNYRTSGIFRRRKMLKVIEGIFYDAGYERTSVWAFTKRGVPKYCSVTVPLYVGLGASGGSYLRDVFYLNTFSVKEYIKALENGMMPIALSIELSENMQMAGWLYWRIYETRFEKGDFKKRFGKDFDKVYGKYMKILASLDLLKDDGSRIVLSDMGAYWLHVLEDLFSIDYISKLWGTSKQEPWPIKVVL
jgi:coproporphyrinogen III oxidase-like Fe-S oxidoreductase